MDEQETQDRIDFYVEVFDELKRKVGSDEIAALLVEQVAKDARVKAMRRESAPSFASDAKSVVHSDEPASQAQILYLGRLGVKLPVNVPITKASASAMIDQALAGR